MMKLDQCGGLITVLGIAVMVPGKRFVVHVGFC
jgi:hypothetical protein